MPYKNVENKRKHEKAYRVKNGAHMNAQRRNTRKLDLVSRMYKAAKARAKKKNVQFTIDISDISIPMCCPLLGTWLMNVSRSESDFAHIPSLDRIVPERGYIKGNVRVISFLANVMKNSASPEQLYVFAMSILKEQGRLGP